MNRHSRRHKAPTCAPITPTRPKSEKLQGLIKPHHHRHQGQIKHHHHSRIRRLALNRADVGTDPETIAMRHRALSTMWQATTVIEAERQVDAKAYRRPKAAIKDTIRRNLKHGQVSLSSIARPVRLRHKSHMKLADDRVRKGNRKSFPRQAETKWLALFMRDGKRMLSTQRWSIT